MSEEKKIVKGGFRATLALVISIVALILAIMAYQSKEKESNFNARIQNLQTKITEMKQDTSKTLNKLRNDTAEALEKIGKSMKQKGTEQGNQP